jgi:hypothetical protein
MNSWDHDKFRNGLSSRQEMPVVKSAKFSNQIESINLSARIIMYSTSAFGPSFRRTRLAAQENEI